MIIKKNYNVIGVMSGTSLDGIDLAAITFIKNEKWRFEIHHAITVPYSQEWKKRLKEGLNLSSEGLAILNKEFTVYLAKTIQNFIEKYDIANLDAVCSHGHTILHRPADKITLQIGNLEELSRLTGQVVVCDFRKQDVEMGGQGAPLVPVGDELLFPEYDYCLNLGGFANVSSVQNHTRIAYDICPINIVLNPLAEKLGFPYDDNGKLARTGNVIPQLLDRLNSLHFYQKPPPKSLGLEWVVGNIFPLLDEYDHPVEDVLCTFTEHCAIQLAAIFKMGSTVLITGGGAYNTYLLERLQYHQNIQIELPSAQIIEFKEALVFGLLGVLKLRDEVNCMASVTGAKNDHSSGVIFGLKNHYKNGTHPL